MRIAYHPGDVLEVDTADNDRVQRTREASASTHAETFLVAGESMDHYIGLCPQSPTSITDISVSALTAAGSNALSRSFAGNSPALTQSADQNPAHSEPHGSSLQVFMSGQADIISGQANIMFGQAAIMQSMNHHFDRLQVEVDKNRGLQSQLVQMQQQMDTKQQQMPIAARYEGGATQKTTGDAVDATTSTRQIGHHPEQCAGACHPDL